MLWSRKAWEWSPGEDARQERPVTSLKRSSIYISCDGCIISEGPKFYWIYLWSSDCVSAYKYERKVLGGGFKLMRPSFGSAFSVRFDSIPELHLTGKRCVCSGPLKLSTASILLAWEAAKFKCWVLLKSRRLRFRETDPIERSGGATRHTQTRHHRKTSATNNHPHRQQRGCQKLLIGFT